MKLSEMTTEQSINALAKLAGPVGNLAGDEEFYAVLNNFAQQSKDASPVMVIDGICRKLIPVALVKHKNDIYQIISILTGKSAKDIAAQKLTETIADVKNSIDQELIDFFT